MDPVAEVTVTSKDGVQGVVDKDATTVSNGALNTLVRFKNGLEIYVPSADLMRQSDGSLYLPLSVADLVRDRSAPRQAAGADGREHQIRIEGGSSAAEDDAPSCVAAFAEEAGATVRIRKTVIEHGEIVDLPLLRDEVEVERVPVHRMVDGPVPIRQEGDTTIISLLREVLVVEKRLMVAEELHITPRRTARHHAQHVSLRVEAAEIESLPAHPDADLRPGA